MPSRIQIFVANVSDASKVSETLCRWQTLDAQVSCPITRRLVHDAIISSLGASRDDVDKSCLGGKVSTASSLGDDIPKTRTHPDGRILVPICRRAQSLSEDLYTSRPNMPVLGARLVYIPNLDADISKTWATKPTCFGRRSLCTSTPDSNDVGASRLDAQVLVL